MAGPFERQSPRLIAEPRAQEIELTRVDTYTNTVVQEVGDKRRRVVCDCATEFDVVS